MITLQTACRNPRKTCTIRSLAKVALLIALIPAGLCSCKDNKQEQAQALQELKSQYRQRLTAAMALMAATSSKCVDICSKHSSAWQSAAGSRYGSIDSAVSSSVSNNQEVIAEVELGKDAIEKIMSQLNSPPEGYSSAHAKIVSVYGTFSSLVSAAASPSGSLMTYNQNVNRIQEELLKSLNELKILIPAEDTGDDQS
jgi:hypothetical protein